MTVASSWLKEMGIAFAVVGVLLLALTVYTGVWPPLVVVESGSMMHPDEDGFGNLGTIDPGDLVLVKAIDGREDVELHVQDGDGRYGRGGDVIVYYPGDDRRRTPIIHRAMTWVEVPEDGTRCVVQWYDGETRTCEADGSLTIDRWGIRDWTPQHSGFITLGDNNEDADQATGRVGGAVAMEWVQGKARGEIPWIGLIKLAISPTPNQYNAPADWVRVGNAYAPGDLWVMLGVSLAGLFLAPMAVEVAVGAGIREYRRRSGENPPPEEPRHPADPPVDPPSAPHDDAREPRVGQSDPDDDAREPQAGQPPASDDEAPDPQEGPPGDGSGSGDGPEDPDPPAEPDPPS